MRQHTAAHRPQSATITRESRTGENELGEPIFKTITVASDVACRFDAESTEFVREDSGERVNTPASVAFDHAVDIEEGDTLTISGPGSPSYGLEVRGIDRQTDHRRARVTKIVVEVERA